MVSLLPHHVRPGTPGRVSGRIRRAWILGLLCLLGPGCSPPAPDAEERAVVPVYESRPSEHPDGSGKYYMGREIARIMEPNAGPDWFERPSRESSELPDRVIQGMDLDSTDVVADIGAGTGYFTFRLSPRVPKGKVLAVDIQPEMLDVLNQRIQAEGVTNVEPILGTVTDPNLPSSSVDVAIIVASYHEFSHPREMMTHIVEALKPGGRFILVEYRGEDATLSISPLRRMTETQARKEMEAVGLSFVETRDILPQQHFMVFMKPVA